MAAAPNITTCANWATLADVQGCAPCSSTTPPAAAINAQLAAASGILFQLSGRKFPGVCTSPPVRPCARRQGSTLTASSYWWGEWHYLDSWGSCSCNRPRECGCSRLSEITLGGYPIVSVTQVKVDGAVLPTSRYRVDDFRYLVGEDDGDGNPYTWPCCQRLHLPDTEPDTFSVTFTYGNAPPPEGVSAAAELACHRALACAGDSACRLPSRAVELTRQGVTMIFGDANEFLDNGRMGLPLVDAFLLAHGHGSNKRGRGFMISPSRARRPIRRAGT